MLPKKDIILAVIAVVNWTLIVIVLAEKYSVYSGMGGGCGVFQCTWGDADSDMWYRCNTRIDHIKASQAFGTMSAIFTGVAMLGHVAAVAVPTKVPPVKLFGVFQFLHIWCSMLVTITWVILVCTFTSELCDRRISDAPSTAAGYGVFFLCSCMVLEIVAFLICRQAVKEEEVPTATPVDWEKQRN